MAYFKRRPFGQDEADLVLAKAAADIVNSSGKLRTPREPKDYLPPIRQEQTPEQMQAILNRVVNGNGQNNRCGSSLKHGEV